MTKQSSGDSGGGVLTGLKVVEYAASVSGPYCARILADAGAEVLKVEPPEGDVARQRGPFPGDIPDPEKSGLFLYLNANKRGITLDIAKAEGFEVFRHLVREADILVENYPPAQAEKLGVTFADLHELNPRLIVTSVTPFGQWGPYRDLKADELVIWSMAAMTWASPGMPDRALDGEKEPPLHPNAPAAGIVTGGVGALATLLALLARDGDGMGRHVDVAGLEAVAAMTVYNWAPWVFGGVLRGRVADITAQQPNCYLPCKDGYVAITAIDRRHWKELTQIIGQPDLEDLEVFIDTQSRATNWDALEPILLEFTMARTGKELEETLQSRGVLCTRAYTIGEVFQSGQMQAREVLWAHDVDGHTALLPSPPYRFSQTPWRLRRPAPRLGEHNSEVLAQAGYRQDDLDRLKALGVL